VANGSDNRKKRCCVVLVITAVVAEHFSSASFCQVESGLYVEYLNETEIAAVTAETAEKNNEVNPNEAPSENQEPINPGQFCLSPTTSYHSFSFFFFRF
jgi:hypothetical protein